MNQEFKLLRGVAHITLSPGGNAICDRVQLLTLVKMCSAMAFVCALFFSDFTFKHVQRGGLEDGGGALDAGPGIM